MMTTEQQRISIAEWMGIKPTTECPDCFGTGYGGSECDHNPCDTCKTTGKVKSYVVSDDYPEDLNAIHGAEMKLNEKQAVWYLQRLAQVRLRRGNGGTIACMIDKLAFATAAQRSEALCRTLWPERWEK